MECCDWSLCFLCQSALQIEKTLDLSSLKLRNNPERLQSCYKEAVDNIQELKALRDMPEFIVDISGCSQDVEMLLINKKLGEQEKEKKHEESVSPVKTHIGFTHTLIIM